jgi:hypothetical protein
MKTPRHNTEFICDFCGKFNEKHPYSERNHCKYCLCSLHLDLHAPGDRKSKCHGKMIPKDMSYSGKKGWQIIHECTVCKTQKKNIIAPDDEFQKIFFLS